MLIGVFSQLMMVIFGFHRSSLFEPFFGIYSSFYGCLCMVFLLLSPLRPKCAL